MREGIWFRTLNVLNLKYERLDHNSAKVVPLQVFGKFSLLLPYDEWLTQKPSWCVLVCRRKWQPGLTWMPAFGGLVGRNAILYARRRGAFAVVYIAAKK